MPPLPINKTTFFFVRGWQYTPFIVRTLVVAQPSKRDRLPISGWLHITLAVGKAICFKPITTLLCNWSHHKKRTKAELLTFTIWCPALTKSNDEGKSIDCYLMVKHVDKTTHWFAHQFSLIVFFCLYQPPRRYKKVHVKRIL